MHKILCLNYHHDLSESPNEASAVGLSISDPFTEVTAAAPREKRVQHILGAITLSKTCFYKSVLQRSPKRIC